MGFGANYACDGQIDMFSYLASISTNAEEKAKNGADNKQECTIKACGATQELCSCHCGADSCCQYCTNECKNRCEYSLQQPKVYDRAKGNSNGWVNNPNCIDPYTMFKRAILKGSGFSNGKKRICEMYRKDMDSRDRADTIKKEYGVGGWGSPHVGNGLHGVNHDAKGFEIEYRDGTENKKMQFSWATIEKEIGKLIKSGEYHE